VDMDGVTDGLGFSKERAAHLRGVDLNRCSAASMAPLRARHSDFLPRQNCWAEARSGGWGKGCVDEET